MSAASQLILDLPVRPALGREDFFVAESNATAVAWIDRWPDWPARADATDNSGAAAATAAAAAASDAVEPAWLPANEDGSTPAGHPVKVKESSGIFHVPGGRFYDRTKPDRCYPTAAAAEADGYRRSKT